MSNFCTEAANLEKPTAQASNNCSFAFSGTNEINQAVYICKTCFPDNDSYGFCIGCANVCHEDHDVEFVVYDDFYCECGCNGCELCRNSVQYTQPSAFLPELKSLEHDFSAHRIDNLPVDSIIEQIVSLVGQSKDTFWISANDSPRCGLEDLAQQIGRYHIDRLFKDKENYEQILSMAGFEWWMQMKQTPTEDSPSNRNTGVDLHYDKDEELADTYCVGIFPTISTVTYLTNNASYNHPTVVFDATSSDEVGNPISEVFISIPQVGKHIAFDGRLLHGAPAELLYFSTVNNQSQSEIDAKLRITFPVNVWIGHKPAAVKPLPTELISMLQVLESKESNKLQNYSFQSLPSSSLSVDISERDVLKEDVGGWLIIPFVSSDAEWEKAEDEAELDLRMWLPFVSIDSFVTAKANKHSTIANGAAVSNFHIKYMTDDIAAVLEYGEESEEEEEK